jgi:ParB-like chromosome segregation protein Spo0J
MVHRLFFFMEQIYEIHPLAACWSKPENYEEIKASIKKDGQLEAIELYEGKILDGVQRYQICGELEITPWVFTPHITDPLAYVLAKNKHRRHATKGQIAMAVAKMAKVPRGGNGSNQYEQKSNSLETRELLSSKQLAEAAGISDVEIERAKQIHAKGSPELIEAVTNGLLCADYGRQISNLPKEAQVSAIQDLKERRKAIKPKKKPAVKVIKPQFERMKFPTFEETGYPVNGTLEEKMAHGEKYGRTPMFAKAVKDMLNNQAMVNTYVASIMSVTNKTHPSAEDFFKAVDAMLAWVPKPEKGPDWKIDFRRKARTQLELLDERLPLAVEQLSKLHETWKQRSLVQSKVVS